MVHGNNVVAVFIRGSSDDEACQSYVFNETSWVGVGAGAEMDSPYLILALN